MINEIFIEKIKKIDKKKEKEIIIFMKNEEKQYHIKLKNFELREKWADAIELLMTKKEGSKQSSSSNIIGSLNEESDIEKKELKKKYSK